MFPIFSSIHCRQLVNSGLFKQVLTISSCLVLLCTQNAVALAAELATYQQANLTMGLPPVPNAALHSEATALLSKALPSQQWQLTQNQQDYENGIKTGELQAFFAQAHIGAWAIVNRSYHAIAKLQAPLYLRVVTRHSQGDVFELGDLQQRPVCSAAAPYLSYQFLQQLYPDEQARPAKHVMNPQTSIDKILTQPCIGLVVNEARLANSPERKQYITLARSERFSQIGLFVRHDVSTEVRKQLLDTLLATTAGQALSSEFARYFSTPTDLFVPAVNSDYPIILQQWLPSNDWPR